MTLNDDYFSGGPLTRQIIVVDDGISDNTAGVAQELKNKINALSVILHYMKLLPASAVAPDRNYVLVNIAGEGEL